MDHQTPIEEQPASAKSRKEEGKDCRMEITSSDLILLDPNDLCSYFSISPRTEFRWRTKGLVPHIRLRGRIYYSLSDIRATLEKYNSSRATLNREE